YNEKLDMLVTLQAELANEINDMPQSKSLIIRSYTQAYEKRRFEIRDIFAIKNSEMKVQK
ncbi:3561_t:CDS:2, partial [Racocetra persica]